MSPAAFFSSKIVRPILTLTGLKDLSPRSSLDGAPELYVRLIRKVFCSAYRAPFTSGRIGPLPLAGNGSLLPRPLDHLHRPRFALCVRPSLPFTLSFLGRPLPACLLRTSE